MLTRFRNLALVSAALCATSAFAAEVKTVNVPFSFVAKNHVYAPGAYTIEVNSTRSMVTLNRIGKPSQPLTWIVIPVGDSNDSKVSLTFDVAGSQHMLRTISYDTFATPNLDPQPKHKVEANTTSGE